MTQSEVINKLSMELAFQTGDLEDIKNYKKYITMALVIGLEHFHRNMEEIVVMTRDGVELQRYRSTDDAAKRLGLHAENITDVLNGHKHSTGGFLFMHAKDKLLIKREELIEA